MSVRDSTDMVLGHPLFTLKKQKKTKENKREQEKTKENRGKQKRTRENKRKQNQTLEQDK